MHDNSISQCSVLWCFRGIRYLSKNCRERFIMIGDLLSQEQLDLALLQEVKHINIHTYRCFYIHQILCVPSQISHTLREASTGLYCNIVMCLFQVWCEKDFLFLKTKLGSVYPYSHYFKRSVMIYNAWHVFTKGCWNAQADMNKDTDKDAFLLFSGFIGSGLAVFSRHRIHDAFLYRYSLNGYPYMVSLINYTHKHRALLLKYPNKDWKNSISFNNAT